MSRLVSILGLAVPNFLVGLMVVFTLAAQFNCFPPLLFVPPWSNPWTNFQQVWAPSAVLAVALGGYVARMTRSSILEVMREDFVRTAQAKGIRYSTVVTRHMLKIALVPVITLSSVQLSALLGATVVVVNLLVDVAYGWLDPRVRVV